ncbi:unnamed protein product, partial [Ectocarpus sp. 12 AP-2014]
MAHGGAGSFASTAMIAALGRRRARRVPGLRHKTLRQQLQNVRGQVPHGDCARRQLKGEGDMSLLLVPDADRSLRPPTTYARPERRRQALDGNPSVVYPHGDGRRRVGKEQPEGNGARAEPYIRDLEG